MDAVYSSMDGTQSELDELVRVLRVRVWCLGVVVTM